MDKTSNKYIWLTVLIVIPLIITIGTALIIRIYVVQAFKIPAGSMLPTIMVGDHILVDKTKGIRESIKRGDIIVFRYPKDRKKSFVKRVIAVGGDIIESKDKNIYINGALLEEPYAHHVDNAMFPKGINPRDNFGPFVVPEDNLFVMGDNRDQSNDSRYWGDVPKEDVLGKAFKIYWSWDKVNNNVRWERIGKAIQN